MSESSIFSALAVIEPSPNPGFPTPNSFDKKFNSRPVAPTGFSRKLFAQWPKASGFNSHVVRDPIELIVEEFVAVRESPAEVGR